MYPELKENRPHGTDNYPYTQYHMHNIFHAFQIPVHWHDELEVIYTKKGPLNLLIDGKEYTAEDGSVYFVAPGQLHLMGSAAGDVDYYTLLFPLEFISFQSDDSLERELFFPLRNHTLSFPCKLPEDHDTAAKASVLLDQIINANSDRIAANQKNGYQNQLGTRILLLKLVLLMAEQDLFIPAIPKAPAVSRKSYCLIFSKITVFVFPCTISPDISICPKNISPGISGNISSLRSRSISRTCGYPTQSICWKPQVSPSQRQHCRAAFQM